MSCNAKPRGSQQRWKQVKWNSSSFFKERKKKIPGSHLHLKTAQTCFLYRLSVRDQCRQAKLALHFQSAAFWLTAVSSMTKACSASEWSWVSWWTLVDYAFTAASSLCRLPSSSRVGSPRSCSATFSTSCHQTAGRGSVATRGMNWFYWYQCYYSFCLSI